MLGPSDHDRIAIISPFLVAIVDRSCELSVCADVTKSFAQYNDTIYTLHGRARSPGWSE